MDLHDPARSTNPIGQRSALLSAAGVKVILDAMPVERMAFLRGSYADVPGDWHGSAYMGLDQLRTAIGHSLEAEEQLAVHAVGR